jgi:hypothetical protein
MLETSKNKDNNIKTKENTINDLNEQINVKNIN